MPRTTWWRDAIIYQVWPASFYDGNGDGVGDLPGLIGKLDYIKSLGVNTIWLSPHYASPRIDEGYDVSDYTAIHPPFGTMADMDRLIEGTHGRGMRLILDLVINHTSDQHQWFKDSRSSKEHPRRDWYIWRPAKYDAAGNRQPPNNWRNNFNGCAWTWDEHTQEYYLHLYCPEQPDLNWTNEACRKEIYKDSMLFWLDKGIDGFRVDTINHYSKPMDFPDAPITDPTNPYQPAHSLYCNGPRIHEYVKEMGEILARYDAFTVGELPSTPRAEDILRYVSFKQQEISCVFDFSVVDLDNGVGQRFLLKDWQLTDLKRAIIKNQKLVQGTDGWISGFQENHDQPRSISRYCSDAPEFRKVAGKMLALVQASLTGTLFVYQGQEIGMTNFPDTWGPEEYKDVDSSNYYNYVVANSNGDASIPAAALKKINKIARDNARTPVQWTAGKEAGFTSGKPWMRVNDNYKEGINVEEEEQDADSVLHFWRKALALRKEHAALFGRGEFAELEPDNNQTFSYFKTDGTQRAFVIANYTQQQQPFELPESVRSGKIVLATHPSNTSNTLEAYEGRIYLA